MKPWPNYRKCNCSGISEEKLFLCENFRTWRTSFAHCSCLIIPLSLFLLPEPTSICRWGFRKLTLSKFLIIIQDVFWETLMLLHQKAFCKVIVLPSQKICTHFFLNLKIKRCTWFKGNRSKQKALHPLVSFHCGNWCLFSFSAGLVAGHLVLWTQNLLNTRTPLCPVVNQTDLESWENYPLQCWPQLISKIISITGKLFLSSH